MCICFHSRDYCQDQNLIRDYNVMYLHALLNQRRMDNKKRFPLLFIALQWARCMVCSRPFEGLFTQAYLRNS